MRNFLRTSSQKKFPKKIDPDSQPSSDTDEERMEMWKNLQQQLQMERELNRMQFEELRTALRTRHENPAPPPPPPIRTEDIPPPRRHPMHGRRTFTDTVPCSILPYYLGLGSVYIGSFYRNIRIRIHIPWSISSFYWNSDPYTLFHSTLLLGLGSVYTGSFYRIIWIRIHIHRSIPPYYWD